MSGINFYLFSVKIYHVIIKKSKTNHFIYVKFKLQITMKKINTYEAK